MSTVIGLLFTLLWASAAIAIKFGLLSTTPLALATIRFILAGGILFLFVYVIKRNRYPTKKEWLPLLILGLLNTTIYLGATFWALESVSAGLFNLIVTTNPFLVALLSAMWLKRGIKKLEWLGMVIAFIGLLIASIPSLSNSSATAVGLMTLCVGMFSMALGSVYFKKANLQISGLVINTWQVLIGGIILLPFTYLLEKDRFFIVYDGFFFGSLVWLTFVISIGTMMLWFYLLKKDPVKANNWLFMTPIYGFVLSALFLGEAVTPFDLTASAFVIVGLFLSGNIDFSFLRKQRVRSRAS